ncbi:MAG: vWA domain-containing protein [Ignavibacteriales bacterium]
MMRNLKLFRKIFALITCFSLLVVFALPVSAVEVAPIIGKADIFILIDKTKSMNQELSYAKTETIDFIKKLQDNNVDCRVGIATFGSHASLNSQNPVAGSWTGFQDIYNEANVETKLTNMIDSLAAHDYIEQTTKAINEAATKLNNEARSDAGKMLIIITDSPALEQSAGFDRDDIADELKSKDINTFFIGETDYVLNIVSLLSSISDLPQEYQDVYDHNGWNDEQKFDKFCEIITSTGPTNEVEIIEAIKYYLFTLFSGTTYEGSYNEILAELGLDPKLYGEFYSIDDITMNKFLAAQGLGKGIAPAYAMILDILLSHYTQTAPVIDTFSVPASLAPTDAVNITAQVHDLDIDASGTGDTLTYALKMQRPDGSTEDITLETGDIAPADATFNGIATRQFTLTKTLEALPIGTYKVIFTVNDFYGARAEAEKTIIVSVPLPQIEEMTDRVTAANKELTPEQIANGLNKYLPGSNVITRVKFKCDGAGNYTVKFEPNAPNGVTVPNLKVIQDSTNADVSDTPVIITDTYSVGTQADGNEITLYIQYTFNKNAPTTPLSSTQLSNKVTVIKDGAPIQDRTNIIEIRDANIIKQ